MIADLSLVLAAIATGAALGSAGAAVLCSLADDRASLRALVPLALGAAGLAAIALAGEVVFALLR